jgi:hypothetical protein
LLSALLGALLDRRFEIILRHMSPQKSVSTGLGGQAGLAI